jgi:hypothetical protein
MSSLAVFLVLGGATAFAAGKIGTNQIKANAIVTGKIKKEAVTEGKIKSGAIGTTRLANGAVTAGKLATGAVGANQLADGAVTAAKLGGNAVGNGNIADGAVNGTKITDGAVTSGKIANGAVTPDKLSQQYLPASTIGVPIAGASINHEGKVLTYFNRAGGAPTVEHTNGSGVYQIKFPGIENKVTNGEGIVLATLGNGEKGFVSRNSLFGNPVIDTFSTAGVATDIPFEMVVVTAGQ